MAHSHMDQMSLKSVCGAPWQPTQPISLGVKVHDQ